MIQIKKVELTQLSLKSRGNKHQPVTLSRTMLINAINTSYGSLKTDPIRSLSTSAQFCEIFFPLPYRASNISRFNNKKTKQGSPCILSSKSKHSLLEGKERARRFMKHEKLVGRNILLCERFFLKITWTLTTVGGRRLSNQQNFKEVVQESSTGYGFPASQPCWGGPYSCNKLDWGRISCLSSAPYMNSIDNMSTSTLE